MAWQDFIDDVQKAYVAYYGRPADPEGLIFWATKASIYGIDVVIKAFGDSDEAKELYPELYQGTLTLDAAKTAINKIYQTLFGRDGEDEGLTYWAEKLVNGEITASQIAFAIANAAQNEDKLAIENKIEAAKLFTEAIDPDLDGKNLQATYSGSEDASKARDFLKNVTWNPSTVPSSSEVTNYIKTNIADTGDQILAQVGGETFDLTTGADIVNGTSGNDYIDGSEDNGSQTFHSFDKIDGGDGYDTLLAQGIGTIVTEEDTLKNVEEIQIVNPAGGATLDLTNTTGVQKIKINSQAGSYNLTGLSQDLTEVDIVGASGNKDTTLEFKTEALSGTSDSLTLGITNVKAVGVAIPTITIRPASGTNGIETLNINVTGGTSNFKVVSTGTEKINISSSAKLFLDLSGITTLTSVDASNSSGNLDLTIPNTKITVKGGSGDDIFDFSSGTFDSNDTVDGGDGTDEVEATAANLIAFTKSANISNIERIGVTGAAAGTINMNHFSGVTEVRLYTTAAANQNNISNLPSGSTIKFDNNYTGAHTIGVKNAASGTSDVLNLVFQKTTGAQTISSTIANVETINITNNATSGANLTLTANGLKELNISGSYNLTLTLTSNSVQTVDASSLTGNFTADLRNVTSAVTIKGGSGNDTLYGGGNTDTLTGGSGNDKFVFSNFGAADKITDFAKANDDIYLDLRNVTFNAAAAPNGILVGGIKKIWNTTGMNITALTMAIGNSIGTAVALTNANNLFSAANVSALKAAVISAVTGNADARGFALGKVGTKLYGIWINDAAPAASSSGATISAVRTIATIGASFDYSDIHIF